MVWLSSMENFSQLFIVFHFSITFLSSIKCQGVVLSTSGWSNPWVEGLSLLVQTVKNLSAMQDFQVRSLGLGDSLEREMATHSSILAWRISRTVEPGGYSPWGCRVGHNSATEHTQHIDAQKKGWKGWTQLCWQSFSPVGYYCKFFSTFYLFAFSRFLLPACITFAIRK